MSDLNRVNLIGRLVRDAEWRAFDQERGVIRFAIAITRSIRKDGSWVNESNFFDVSYFTTSDKMLPFLKKGSQIGLDGELRQNRWETPEGQKQSRVEIQAQRVFLLGSKENSSSNNNYSDQNSSDNQNEGYSSKSKNNYASPQANQASSAPKIKEFSQDEFEEDFPF